MSQTIQMSLLSSSTGNYIDRYLKEYASQGGKSPFDTSTLSHMFLSDHITEKPK